MSKEYLIRNKYRGVKNKLFDVTYISEYEKLGIEPLTKKDIGKDFMNEKLRSRAPRKNNQPAPQISVELENKSNLVGFDSEHVWIPKKENDIALSSVEENSYVIVYDGAICYTTQSLEQLENLLDEILLDEEGIDFKKLSVFKRMLIKMGASIK
jgi:hypothetical protein